MSLTACNPPGLLDDGGVELLDSGAASSDAGLDAGVLRCPFPLNGDSALELNNTANVRGADCDFIDSLVP